MKHGKLWQIFLTARYVSFASILLLIGCTHAGRPYLTPEEKAQARLELSKWPTGRVVTYLTQDGINLRARFYSSENSMKAVVVALHGIETTSKWYAPLAQEQL
jgi:hypothetical protein